METWFIEQKHHTIKLMEQFTDWETNTATTVALLFACVRHIPYTLQLSSPHAQADCVFPYTSCEGCSAFSCHINHSLQRECLWYHWCGLISWGTLSTYTLWLPILVLHMSIFIIIEFKLCIILLYYTSSISWWSWHILVHIIPKLHTSKDGVTTPRCACNDHSRTLII